MLRIQQLLNPEQIDKHSATQPPPPPPPPPLLMSSIMSTNMTSTVAFPPHAILSRRNGAVPQGMAELAQCHDQFQVSLRGGLSGRIQDSRRRIPYSSDRRGFLARTGREAFEIFEYEFRVPGDPPGDKAHSVMWDYEIGLVRVTPFFKACKYSKVIPKRALDANGNLQSELSHNVTGGALIAQGYWTPYHCARALCITFCYPIRWALTPIFGPSFVNECLAPNDPDFGRFRIDPQLVLDAEAEAKKWDKRNAQSSRQQPSSSQAGISTRGSTARAATAKKTGAKKLEPRQKSVSRSLAQPGSNEELRYGKDSPPVSPKTIPAKSKHEVHSNTWSAVNEPGDSVTSERPLMSPYIGAITPLLLPAPVMSQPASVNNTIHKSVKHKKRKADNKAKQTPTSYPAATVLDADVDNADDAYYGTIDDYIVLSPVVSEPSMSPPSKKARQPDHGFNQADTHSQEYDIPSVSGRKVLSKTEMAAVYGLLKLIGQDGETSQEPIGID